MAPPKVLRVTGTVILEWDNGMRVAISPPNRVDEASVRPERTLRSVGRPGRKPSPATQALIDAMAADAAKGEARSSADYLAILQGAGHKGSVTSARLIVSREAKRAFGRSLGRTRVVTARPTKGAARGRSPSPAIADLRAKLAADKTGSGLRDAGHYIRWLVDHANLGLKQARPIVYRELRAAR